MEKMERKKKRKNRKRHRSHKHRAKKERDGPEQQVDSDEKLPYYGNERTPSPLSRSEVSNILHVAIYCNFFQ